MSEMDIKEDAGESLKYIYVQYRTYRTYRRVQAREFKRFVLDRLDEHIAAERNLDKDRTNIVIGFLENSKLIKKIKHTKKIEALGGTRENVPVYTTIELTKEGFSTVEDPQKFKSTFGYEIGIL